jgi:GNAT superfamily N-acetyltransferase
MRELDDWQRDAARSIYVEAFPAWQRQPFDDLIAREAAGQAILVVAVCDGEPLGLAVASSLGSVNWSFVEYFAVAPNHRGRGIGEWLWRAMGQDLALRGLPRRIVLEVDDPARTPAGTPERRQCDRRLRFYERQGMRCLPVSDYAIPRMDGIAGSDPMLLLWTKGSTEPPGLAELRSLVSALYSMAYDLSADHPLVLAALLGSAGKPPGRHVPGVPGCHFFLWFCLFGA